MSDQETLAQLMAKIDELHTKVETLEKEKELTANQSDLQLQLAAQEWSKVTKRQRYAVPGHIWRHLKQTHAENLAPEDDGTPFVHANSGSISWDELKQLAKKPSSD